MMPDRCCLDGVLSVEECKELIFIHKSLGVVGYRPHVFSTTLHDVLATCPPLILPLVKVRSKILDAVEEALGRECELSVEFTGLVSWSKGARIGWHYDSNRDYLQQRHYSAVLYLNNGDNVDFGGGNFLFKTGTPSPVTPRAGRLIAYSADESNIHSVEEVTWGKRFTLTMWFTRDPQFCEDHKLLLRCAQIIPPSTSGDPERAEGVGECNDSTLRCTSKLPLAGFAHPGLPNEMYGKHGSDVRVERMAGEGFKLHCLAHKNTGNDCNGLCGGQVALERCQGQSARLLEINFVNSVHALLVLHFHRWKNGGGRTDDCFIQSVRELEAYLQQHIKDLGEEVPRWQWDGVIS